MVKVQSHGLVPLPKGPCPSFHIPLCVGSLLWKAKLFGFLVYSEVPQTSSSISEPVTNNYSELEASSLPEAEPISLPNQTGRPCLKPVPTCEKQSYQPTEVGRGFVAVEIDHSPGNCSLLRAQSEKLNKEKFFTSRPCSW